MGRASFKGRFGGAVVLAVLLCLGVGGFAWAVHQPAVSTQEPLYEGQRATIGSRTVAIYVGFGGCDSDPSVSVVSESQRRIVVKGSVTHRAGPCTAQLGIGPVRVTLAHAYSGQPIITPEGRALNPWKGFPQASND